MRFLKPRSSADKQAIAFAVTFGCLALASVALLLHPFVVRNIVDPFTDALVVICSTGLNLFGAKVSAHGNVLAFIGAPGAVAVANGCNAVEVCLLLASAIIAWPTSIKSRVIGVVACVTAVQAINLVRIISLLFLARYSPPLFNFFHLFVWEAVIVLESVVAFFVWMRWQSRVSAAPAKAAET